MYQLSSAMAAQFVELTEAMREQVARLGPNPLKNGQDHEHRPGER